MKIVFEDETLWLRIFLFPFLEHSFAGRTSERDVGDGALVQKINKSAVFDATIVTSDDKGFYFAQSFYRSNGGFWNGGLSGLKSCSDAIC